MPPRSVCLNVFTSSLGDGNGAVNTGRHSIMDRRDSAQSGMLESFLKLQSQTLKALLRCILTLQTRHSETVL